MSRIPQRLFRIGNHRSFSIASFNVAPLTLLLALLGWLAAANGCDARQDRPAPPQTDELARLIGEAGDRTRGQQFAKAVESWQSAVALQPENVRLQMELGRAQFTAGSFKDCIATYDRVIELDPSSAPYLWQRGLALYYADRFQEGRQQFETHQRVNTADVENSVWHLLCLSRLSGVEEARKEMIPIEGDARVPMAEVFQLFAGSKSPADVLRVASAAGTPEIRRRQEYYAYLYIGLYQEMLKKPELARKALQQAAERNPYPADVLMGQVARVHLALRKWPEKRPRP